MRTLQQLKDYLKEEYEQKTYEDKIDTKRWIWIYACIYSKQYYKPWTEEYKDLYNFIIDLYNKEIEDPNKELKERIINTILKKRWVTRNDIDYIDCVSKVKRCKYMKYGKLTVDWFLVNYVMTSNSIDYDFRAIRK